MGAGLMQLITYGAQDIYITGNPQITFFKIVYRRHTNFAVETISQPLIGTIGFNKNVSVKINKSGDLISKMYLRIILNTVDPQGSNFAWVRRIGHAIIKQVDISVGGSVIDRHYGQWLDIWYELSKKGYHDIGYSHMIGDVSTLTDYNKKIKREYVLYVPLQFWFNKFVGLSIPLIALQYHDVDLNIQFEEIDKLIIRDCNFNMNIPSIKDATLLVNYIYLDTDERKRFATVGHEYLIEQLQFNGIEQVLVNEGRYILDFNHPTKEIIWAVKNGNYSSSKQFLYYSNKNEWSLIDASCKIIESSILINKKPNPEIGGDWVKVKSGESGIAGTFNIINKNKHTVYINPTSLFIGNYGITNKINADVIINKDGTIRCENIVTTLTIRDLSIPLEYMTDTRNDQCDPIVNIFSNYGLLIDGSYNPIEYSLLQFNGNDRFDRREGIYFNNVQAEAHHENIPKDGINLYSFALYPEEHQPSGTANLSMIDNSTLILWFNDSTYENGLPDLRYFNDNNQLFIFASSYNIFRVFSGLGAVAYVV